jgi:hypothetical protein
VRALVADASLPAGVAVVLLLLAVLVARETRRIRTGGPGAPTLTTGVVVLGSLFVAVVVARFVVLA